MELVLIKFFSICSQFRSIRPHVIDWSCRSVGSSVSVRPADGDQDQAGARARLKASRVTHISSAAIVVVVALLAGLLAAINPTRRVMCIE